MSTKSEPSRRRSALEHRLETRVSHEDKALLQRAASLENRSVTDFVRTSARNAAIETIRRHESMTISTEDASAFVDALMSSPPPNMQLRDAASAHRELIGR